MTKDEALKTKIEHEVLFSKAFDLATEEAQAKLQNNLNDWIVNENNKTLHLWFEIKRKDRNHMIALSFYGLQPNGSMQYQGFNLMLDDELDKILEMICAVRILGNNIKLIIEGFHLSKEGE